MSGTVVRYARGPVTGIRSPHTPCAVQGMNTKRPQNSVQRVASPPANSPGLRHSDRGPHTECADYAAIVLAGGAARRMGVGLVGAEGKAGLQLTGRTFLDAIVTTLATSVTRVIVVAAPEQPLPPVDVPAEIVRDSTPGAGPLAAIRDGLAHLLAAGQPPQAVLVASCDVPLLAPAVVRLLLDRLAASSTRWVVPVVHGHPQVLVSAITPELLGPIDRHLAVGRRDLRGLLDELRRSDPAAVAVVTEAEVAAADPDCLSFVDVDTPADLEAVHHRRIPPSPE
jgi:molybdopterin-guanine dinucleotide biosynthesis protein A